MQGVQPSKTVFLYELNKEKEEEKKKKKAWSVDTINWLC